MHTDMLCMITNGDFEKVGILSFGHVTHQSKTDDKTSATFQP